MSKPPNPPASFPSMPVVPGRIGSGATVAAGTSSRLVAGGLAVTIMLLALPEASAIDRELTLGLGPGYTDLPANGSRGQPGLGSGVYAEFRLSDWWGVTAGGYSSYQLSVADDELPGVAINSAWLGVLYNIDVATYVPFVTLAATAYFADPELSDADGHAADAGVKFGLGVDYRRHRHWSLGVEGNFHAFLTDVQNYPVYLTTLLRLNYHFEPF